MTDSRTKTKMPKLPKPQTIFKEFSSATFLHTCSELPGKAEKRQKKQINNINVSSLANNNASGGINKML